VIEAVQKDDAFLEDVRVKRGLGELSIWWLGQSGFLVQSGGKHLLIDPYLSDSLTKKYAETDKPHVRMTERVIAPERLDFIDLITSSHNHTDHFDPETLDPLLSVNPATKIILPEANRGVSPPRLSEHNDPERFIGIDADRTQRSGGINVHGIAAAHNKLERDERGHHKFLGYVFDIGRWRVYHSGDCRWYPGLAEGVRLFRPDVAILPINGDEPGRRVAGNFDGLEAARLAKDIKTKIVMPCHFEMFEFNTVEPDLFVKSCDEIDQPYKVMRSGERWSSEEFG
tara:strand:+ start:11494 stop:12345 length:852 start_codon:yes stop_codon:yes gene_type:complete